jgi:hypothetical protein
MRPGSSPGSSSIYSWEHEYSTNRAHDYQRGHVRDGPHPRKNTIGQRDIFSKLGLLLLLAGRDSLGALARTLDAVRLDSQ